MKRALIGVLLGSAALCASAYAAEDYDQPHVLDKVNVTGSRSVSTDKLMAVLQEHPGSRVVKSDILADREAIMKVLEDAHVGGAVGVAIAPKTNKHIVVTFKVTDQGVQAPTVTKVLPRLHQELFEGNKAIISDKLMAAAGINPGDELTNEKLLAAQKAIIAVYQASKQPISVTVNAETRTAQGTTVDVIWKITETKAKQKKQSLEDQERNDQVQ